MAALILIITSFGYVSLKFAEPLGLKRYNTSRDVLLKSFLAGLIWSITIFKFRSESLDNILKGKVSEFNFIILGEDILSISNFMKYFGIWIIFLILLKSFNKLILDKYTFKCLQGESGKAMYSLIGKVVLLNVRPNKLYTGILKSCWDVDDIKGIDLLEITPIISSFYDENGDVVHKRYYTDSNIRNEDVVHENSILIKYEDVSQIRAFDETLYDRFNKETGAVSSIERNKVIERYQLLVDEINNIKNIDEIEESMRTLLDKIDPNKLLTNKKIENLTLDEVEKLEVSYKIIFSFCEHSYHERFIDKNYRNLNLKIIDYGDWLSNYLLKHKV